MKKVLLFLLLTVSLYAEVSTEIFAKWNINYGDLLVDQGKYLEAYEAYESAIESTTYEQIKIEAKLKEANILHLYLNDTQSAVKTYLYIYEQFNNSNQAEFALYQASMLQKELSQKGAILLYDAYLNRYKGGKFYFQIKFLRDKLANKLQHTKTYIPKQNVSEKLIKIVEEDTTKTKQNIIKKPKNKALIRVALHKKRKKETLSGRLNINNQLVTSANFNFKNGKIAYNGQLYKELEIYSNSPIQVKSKNKKYKGFIRLIAKKNYFRVINVVDIESYIYGVVTSESISSWKLEALKSQATASRTFAYYQSMVRKNWDYDVLDNTGDQVYKGINGEHKNGIKATNETSGVIIMHNNKPILAQYTANSGWHSSSSSEIFNVNKPYLYSHKDSFSKKMPLGTWMKKVSIQDIQKAMEKKGIKIGKLLNIVPYEVGQSGRIIKVEFKGTNGTKVLRSYTSIRRFADLRDILMTIEKDGNNFYFKGGGFGHGVGYSQWGGQSMAKAGHKYDEILKFYYKNIELEKLW
jgi:stage II sporulation protein D